MTKAFVCCLCQNGIHGGALFLDPQTVTIVCKKTRDEKHIKLVLPLCEIEGITWKRRLFPVATFHMRNNEEYGLLIFDKTRFDMDFKEYHKNFNMSD